MVFYFILYFITLKWKKWCCLFIPICFEFLKCRKLIFVSKNKSWKLYSQTRAINSKLIFMLYFFPVWLNTVWKWPDSNFIISYCYVFILIEFTVSCKLSMDDSLIVISFCGVFASSYFCTAKPLFITEARPSYNKEARGGCLCSAIKCYPQTRVKTYRLLDRWLHSCILKHSSIIFRLYYNFQIIWISTFNYLKHQFQVLYVITRI